MAMSEESSKTITINLPVAVAERAEALAVNQGRSLSDLFDEAFRDYMGDVFLRSMEDIRQYAQTRNPYGYTEEDIPRLIKEVRAETAAHEAGGLKSAKAS